MNKPKIERVTVDLDSKNKIKLLWIRIVLFVLNAKNISIKQSPSKKGYHIEAWMFGMSKKTNLFIRKILLDDPMRVSLDAKSGRQIQVLFDKKKVKLVDKRDI